MHPFGKGKSHMLRLWDELETSTGATAVRQLPPLLTRGASPLEIARFTHTNLTKINDALSKLEDSGIVESQSSDSTTPFPETLRVYHLTSDGVLFFREMLGRSTSDW